METRKCLVCSVPISTTNMGFDVCRACAAFYKRTLLAGRTFTCRFRRSKPKIQCTFRKDEKFMCRSCRFDRCIELGLELNEPRRRRKNGSDEEDMLPNILFEPTNGESILKRMTDAYKASHDRRFVKEIHYVADNNLIPMDHPNKEIYLVDITQYYEMLRIRMYESEIMIADVFDEFNDLSSVHRATLLRNFLGRFCFTEGLFLSSRYFKERFYFMTSLLTCLDPCNTDDWVHEEHKIERKDELRTSMKGFTDEYKELMEPMLLIEELTETELHALLVLEYCDLNADLQLPEEIVQKAEETRLKVFEELQEYYRNELQLRDFSKRLGNLMTVAHEAGEASVKVIEEMRMYATMFNLYSDDRLFREIFLN